jgi:hypothetical protein
MEPIVFADQAFNGKDVLALDFNDRINAAINWSPIHKDCTCTTFALATSLFSARQF